MGNVLPEFLSFSGHPFPPPPTSPDQPFPDLIQTQSYLRKFAEPLFTTGKIRLNTEVVAVEQIGPDGGWKVVLKDWTDQGKGREIEERWDAVVVATAWYDNPNWPETEGLEELRRKGIAKHAKIWDGPEEFKGKVSFPSEFKVDHILMNTLSLHDSVSGWSEMQTLQTT
jgi:cation diffusion facilitator CzcD-associated flavoprotein CzcO